MTWMRKALYQCDSLAFLAEIAMASFKKVHEMLCLCLIEEVIVEEEFVLLYEAYRPSNLPFPHLAYEKFSLVNKDPAECKTDFRVEKKDIPLLLDALRVLPVFQYCNGTICDVYWMASCSYVQNITELKEGMKTQKFNQIALHNSNLNVLV